MSKKMKKAAVLGASGYTGAETVRLINGHPLLELTALTGHSRAGESFAQIFPNFAHIEAPDVTKWEDVDWSDIDVAFACLPHGASQETISQIVDHVETVIDLSADFRLRDPALYEATYGRSHDFHELLATAIYGLTEYARQKLPGAKLVACPGCYPTCSLLSLLPGVQANMIDLDHIVIDAKSGVTGAGRKALSSLSFSEVAEGAHAYGVGVHRHAPEIDQIIARASGEEVTVSFTPHLVPMNRGEITTCYVRLKPGVSVEDLRQAYADRYEDEPFVHVEAEGITPQTRYVRASNHCRIGVFADRAPDRAIIIGVIDNLTKGSSGQAIQNYNVTQGWDERLGLMIDPVFP